MRLQQIRDWLGGQAFADLSQHRIAGGLAMHWSRLPDLVPGALIALLTPLVGQHAAELTTVIAWPFVLFATALSLIGRVARTLGAPGGTAMVVAALAYPATGLFLPGRIDHHSLQMDLLLTLLLAVIDPASRGRAAVGGVAAAASLIVGLETAPLIALLFTAAALEWHSGEDRRVAGLAVGFGGALFVGIALFRPLLFDWPACDGFTMSAFRAEAIGAAALVALTIGSGLAISRTAILAAVATAAAGAILLAAPGCLSPYGGVDPWLAQIWLGRVAEAQPLYAAPFALGLGQAGLAIAGLLVTGWSAWRTRSRGWLVLFALLAVAVALSFVQLRALCAAALFAAPGLAALIAGARDRGSLPLIAAWLVSAGILYPLAARPFEANHAPGPDTAPSCASLTPQLAQLPANALVLAPPDVGAYGIAATRLRFLAAPYHRNALGNRTAYRFLLADERGAGWIARHTGANYVLFCGDLGGLQLPPDSIAARLARGDPPAWLTGTGIYRVEPRLFDTPRPR